MYKKILIVWVILIGTLFPLAAKDIYVAAGSHGNGSQASPYGTIADAFDMGVYAGDVIHVAEGIYYGKGGSGKWVIAVNNITLVGGYKRDFSARDPWKYQSILIRGMGDTALAQAKERKHSEKWGLSLELTKASYNGQAMILGEGEHSGVIIDGFVIDGYTRNAYKSNGDLKTDVGPIGTPLVQFNKPGCRVRNCIVLNSGGPGIRLGAYGEKDNLQTWSEVSNCIIINTLMEALDFRIGNLDPDHAPNGGYAVIKNNTIAFIWSQLGEGYGILIGRQTNLSIENNIICFATDYALNNGFGNNKARLINNCFFNNMGGVYRFFDAKNSITVVEDDPVLFSGKAARKKYYLDADSAGNYISDPKLNVDPDFFDRFTNQIKSAGGGKIVWDEVNQWRAAMGLPLIGTTGSGKLNYAPIYEHEYMMLASSAVAAGAKTEAAKLEKYASTSATVDKTYQEIAYKDLATHAGEDVTVTVNVGQEEPSAFYVEGISRDQYVCFRTKDMQVFLYVPQGSEALEVMKECKADGIPALVSGQVKDISAAIKMKGRYAIVVESADYGD